MAEDKNKQNPEELQDEQLNEVNGGIYKQKPPFSVTWPHSGSFDKLIITTMAEDLKKQQEELQEEQLQDEQLQEVNGGRYSIVFIN